MESSIVDAPRDQDLGENEPEQSYEERLAEAREEQGLDPVSALPVAADDDGSDVDLSAGVELQLPGLEGGVKLSFKGIGGKAPEESELRLVGGAFKVEGQFEKGQDVYVEVRGRVQEVGFADVLDNKTAQATTSKRKHKARVIGAVVIAQSSREKLEELVAAVQGHLQGTVSDSVLEALVAGEAADVDATDE
jgi:hypothetical protein